MKTNQIIILALSLVLVSCGNPKEKKSKPTEVKVETMKFQNKFILIPIKHQMEKQIFQLKNIFSTENYLMENIHSTKENCSF